MSASTPFDLLKAARGRWMTGRELANELDTEVRVIHRYIDEAIAQGLLVSRPAMDASGEPVKKASREYTVAAAWGGVAA
jgi:DNA-binding transcriptional MocR family regulator